jgi:hypothetical protein
MQVAASHFKLLSLLLVFLTENFESQAGGCDVCLSSTPKFSKVFHINSRWVCVNCILERISANQHSVEIMKRG